MQTFTNLQFKPKLPPRQSLPIKSPGQVVLTCRRLPRRAQKCMCQSARPRQKDNPVVVGVVTAMTEALRALGVGKQEYEQVLTQQPQAPLPPGDVEGVMQRISGDFKQGYIVTGIIDDSIYDENCFFADPTVAFSGLKLWKRNLQLLVPFLIQPSVRMLDIRRTDSQGGSQTLRSEWELRTYLNLPWRPLISILGATDYTLNEQGNKVVEHVESWNVSGAQAILQMFRPGNPPPDTN